MVRDGGCSVLMFFFFQAEDGIRDHCVTGVQTCALPISVAPAQQEVQAPEQVRQPESGVLRLRALALETRSEERRVGKSVEIGGGRITKKKKRRPVLAQDTSIGAQ